MITKKKSEKELTNELFAYFCLKGLSHENYGGFFEGFLTFLFLSYAHKMSHMKHAHCAYMLPLHYKNVKYGTKNYKSLKAFST